MSCRSNINERVKTLMENLRARKKINFAAVFLPSTYQRQRTVYNEPAKKAKLSKQSESDNQLDFILDSQQSFASLGSYSPQPTLLSLSPSSPEEAVNNNSTPAENNNHTPVIGDSLEVLWGDKWFVCDVKKTRTDEDGLTMWLCYYKGCDGKGRWHNLLEQPYRHIPTVERVAAPATLSSDHSHAAPVAPLAAPPTLSPVSPDGHSPLIMAVTFIEEAVACITECPSLDLIKKRGLNRPLKRTITKIQQAIPDYCDATGNPNSNPKPNRTTPNRVCVCQVQM